MRTIERELRRVGDALSQYGDLHAPDSETSQALSWASIHLHHIANRLRAVVEGLVELRPPDAAGMTPEEKLVLADKRTQHSHQAPSANLPPEVATGKVPA